jgi:hypothetical protein
MNMNSARLALCFVTALALPACSAGIAGIAQLDPHPNVLLARSTQVMTFEVAAQVPEQCSTGIVNNAGMPVIGADHLDVAQWHETLANGFRNGIARFFVQTSSRPDLTLVIVDATPILVRVPGPAVTAQVRFQAELVDANRKIVKTWAGTATARRVGSIYDRDMLVGNAVEGMYEEIANGLPVPHA